MNKNKNNVKYLHLSFYLKKKVCLLYWGQTFVTRQTNYFTRGFKASPTAIITKVDKEEGCSQLFHYLTELSFRDDLSHTGQQTATVNVLPSQKLPNTDRRQTDKMAPL